MAGSATKLRSMFQLRTTGLLRGPVDDNSVAGVKCFARKRLRAKQNCHPDRSEAEWRDLRFLFPVLTHALKPNLLQFVFGPTKVVP
jgi:hypothetical protein